MLLARDFRENARNVLSGRWGVAVGTGFIASLLGAYTALGSSGGSSSSSSSIDSVLEEVGYGLSDEVAMVVAVMIMLIAMVTLVWSIAQLIISGPISLGYVKFNLNLVDRNQPQFKDLFSQFDHFGRAFLLQLLRSLFIFLWALLLFVPGIIAQYKYAMAPYIMCEHPEMSAMDAIKASKELMDGNKGRLFCLNFSFIGWDILCAFTLGIGYLWLRPYREAAYAAFYRDISAAKYGIPTMGDDSNQGNGSYNYYDAAGETSAF